MVKYLNTKMLFISCTLYFAFLVASLILLSACGRDNGPNADDRNNLNNGTKWSSVTEGVFHTLAVKIDGTLWAWGFNGYAQLGDGTTNSKHTPTKIGNDTDWESIAAGGYHTFAFKTVDTLDNGTLWTWGYNLYGQLGYGTTTDRHTPTCLGITF
jgi:alpha-tubulin suppressor-like RCC1 family protein